MVKYLKNNIYFFVAIIIVAIIFLTRKYMGKSNKDFILWLKPYAKIVGSIYSIPYKFMIAQISLESGYGKSELTRKYFNFGGQKAVGNQQYVEYQTKEFVNGQYVTIKSKFRKFNTVTEGLTEYAKFFHVNKRYKNALTKPDPIEFAYEIKKAGYATDPNYVSKIKWILDNYKEEMI